MKVEACRAGAEELSAIAGEASVITQQDLSDQYALPAHAEAERFPRASVVCIEYRIKRPRKGAPRNRLGQGQLVGTWLPELEVPAPSVAVDEPAALPAPLFAAPALQSVLFVLPLFDCPAPVVELLPFVPELLPVPAPLPLVPAPVPELVPPFVPEPADEPPVEPPAPPPDPPDDWANAEVARPSERTETAMSL